MYKLLFLFLLLTNLYSKVDNTVQNPVVYAALGDTIYNNVDKIEELKNFKEYHVYLDELLPYVKEVRKIKAMGYKIEEGDKSISKSEYLTKLRELSKMNDFFVQNVKSNFKYALKNKDNKLFVNAVDSGLINTKRYQKDIKKYYHAHEDEIEEYGDILSMIVNGYKASKKKERISRGPTKQDIQEEKIRRIRKKDREKQAALHKSLEEELSSKKEGIRKVQKEELRTTSK